MNELDTAVEIEAAIERQRAIPVVRARTPGRAVEICASVTRLGFDVIELTATIPDWARVIEHVRKMFPDATVGLGTVTTSDQAELACAAGAHFLVSPCRADGARSAAVARGVPFITGGFTPTEIGAASRLGLCKLFPARLGGLAYLAQLTAVFPSARIVPTGGIPISDVGAWLNAGAVAVGVGEDLYGTADVGEAAARLRHQLDSANP